MTCPRKISSGAGDVIAIGGESCAATRSKTKRKSKRSFISRTYKFNMKREGSQIFNDLSLRGTIFPGTVRDLLTGTVRQCGVANHAGVTGNLKYGKL
jgi:hypothetical protein